MKIFTKKTYEKRGFTLAELLVVFAIMALVGNILWGALSNYRDVQVIESTADVLVATLNEARSKAISSVLDMQHGVHFTQNSVTQFEGNQYLDSGVNNIVTTLNKAVSISFTGLTASSSDIIFEKFSGRGSASGEIIVFLSENPAKNFSIIVESTGIVYRK